LLHVLLHNPIKILLSSTCMDMRSDLFAIYATFLIDNLNKREQWKLQFVHNTSCECVANTVLQLPVT
jgi:hypothetical protein